MRKLTRQSRMRRVVATALVIAVATILVPLGAESASASLGCAGYQDFPGTVRPYDLPTGSMAGEDSFACGGHTGQDFIFAEGTPIPAVATGTIVERGWAYTKSNEAAKGCHGKYIVVRDNQGVFSAYAHLSDIVPSATVGSSITRGDIIAYSGNTGVASVCGAASIGHHLHLSIAYSWPVTSWGSGWYNGTFTNPVTYIQHH